MPSPIDLSGDRLEVASPAHVREAAKSALDAGETHYTTRPGLIPLRQAIAESHGKTAEMMVDPLHQVLVTCGEEEALFVAIHTLVGPGDEVLVLGPSPASDATLVHRAGGTTRRLAWPAPVEGSDPGAWLQGSLSERTRVVLLRNPSLQGAVLGAQMARALLLEAVARNATVISVESLADFGRGGQRPRGFAATPGASARTLTIGGFSVWGLDGWRVGYMIGPEVLVAPMTNLKQALSICSPALGQHAALAAATGSQRHLADICADLDERWGALVAELGDSGVHVTAAEAGYHLFVPVAGRATAVAAEIWDAVSVRVAPGDDSGVEGTVRITLSQPAPILAEAAGRMAPLLLAGIGREARRG